MYNTFFKFRCPPLFGGLPMRQLPLDDSAMPQFYQINLAITNMPYDMMFGESFVEISKVCDTI